MHSWQRVLPFQPTNLNCAETVVMATFCNFFNNNFRFNWHSNVYSQVHRPKRMNMLVKNNTPSLRTPQNNNKRTSSKSSSPFLRFASETKFLHWFCEWRKWTFGQHHPPRDQFHFSPLGLSSCCRCNVHLQLHQRSLIAQITQNMNNHMESTILIFKHMERRTLEG